MNRHIRNVVRDESGITMGLAVIMIVLIGVMGAGLLAFVRNDLGSVVEVTKGRRRWRWPTQAWRLRATIWRTGTLCVPAMIL